MAIHERFHKWFSESLEKEFEMLSFGKSGVPLILFPTSCGRYYQNKDFLMIATAEPFIESGFLRIYCPDGVDSESFFNDSASFRTRLERQNQYDECITNEVIDFIRKETSTSKVMVGGCSLGGYHAINTALRHPTLVSHVMSFSAPHDVNWIMGEQHNDLAYFHSPNLFLPNLTDENQLGSMRTMKIILSTGHLDMCREENHKLSWSLNNKNIPHWLDDRHYVGHDWPWWRDLFYEYLFHLFSHE